MKNDIIPVTKSFEEISIEELEEKIELACEVYSPVYNSCCW